MASAGVPRRHPDDVFGPVLPTLHPQTNRDSSFTSVYNDSSQLPTGTWDVPLQGSCPICKHWHNKVPLRLSNLPNVYNGVRCQNCSYKWFGLGRSPTHLSLISRETTDSFTSVQSLREFSIDYVVHGLRAASIVGLSPNPSPPDNLQHEAPSSKRTIPSLSAEGAPAATTQPRRGSSAFLSPDHPDAQGPDDSRRRSRSLARGSPSREPEPPIQTSTKGPGLRQKVMDKVLRHANVIFSPFKLEIRRLDRKTSDPEGLNTAFNHPNDPLDGRISPLHNAGTDDTTLRSEEPHDDSSGDVARAAELDTSLHIAGLDGSNILRPQGHDKSFGDVARADESDTSPAVLLASPEESTIPPMSPDAIAFHRKAMTKLYHERRRTTGGINRSQSTHGSTSTDSPSRDSLRRSASTSARPSTSSLNPSIHVNGCNGHSPRTQSSQEVLAAEGRPVSITSDYPSQIDDDSVRGSSDNEAGPSMAFNGWYHTSDNFAVPSPEDANDHFSYPHSSPAAAPRSSVVPPISTDQLSIDTLDDDDPTPTQSVPRTHLGSSAPFPWRVSAVNENDMDQHASHELNQDPPPESLDAVSTQSIRGSTDTRSET